MATDGAYDNVALLLHGDGADGGLVFTDSSPRPKTITRVGAVATSTAQSKFGGSAMVFNGTNAYLKVEDHDDFHMDTNSWTMEGWFYEAVTTPAATLMAQMAQVSGEDSSAFYIESVSGYLKAFFYTVNGLSAKQVAVAHSLNAWHHFAVVSDNLAGAIYLDGALAGSFVIKGPLLPSAGRLTLGVRLYENNPQTVYVYFNGYMDDIRITKGVARYTGPFTVPAEAFPNEGAPVLNALCAAPLPSAAALVWNDFAAQLGDVQTRYVMDLSTPTGAVRVPVSSWQATLRSGGSSYVQCVVPACLAWVASIQSATEFVIYRQAPLPGGGVIDYEMARSPLEQVAFDRGPARYTATLSGYADGFAAGEAEPPAVYDRALAGVRSVSSGTGGMRVRCAVDWLLRPGHRAFVDGQPFVVAYINYYAPSGGDSYMDVGSL